MNTTLKNFTPPVLIQDLGMQYSTSKSKYKIRHGIYKCHCGKEFKARFQNVKHGHTKSCGCLILPTHGMLKHKIYFSWQGMKDRCHNNNSKYYKNYGGRGIIVCDRWLHSFENFRDDMLPTWKEGLSIDRIDVNGNYEPSNCRWATPTIQSRNTRIFREDNTSGFRGVSWNKKSKKWVSNIRIDNIKKYIGAFNDIIEAAKAYDNYVIENNLEHTINGV